MVLHYLPKRLRKKIIKESFFKRDIWWASIDYKNGTIWGTGKTEQLARDNAYSNLLSIVSYKSSKRDPVSEWISINDMSLNNLR